LQRAAATFSRLVLYVFIMEEKVAAAEFGR